MGIGDSIVLAASLVAAALAGPWPLQAALAW
jgi:hypothetical protein